ncbi:cephalosporin esterase [Cylindrobasidium torrendii FP15055 ss-10]|uniref:Carboxylic ester hydrolase n=1 Tax=Cylindrobasidium torrendii FP15055 ss-10 TaxID=1314674 RepID=A0A0D7ATV2_9AGAR|nr:cephalosporin esterase [Cylindrobasidium torrendii FP15055 ss-10]
MLPLKNALLFFVLSLAVAALSQADTAPVVELGYATYAGSYVGDTTHFVGMRYAAPPIDALRWRAPQALSTTADTVENATAIPARCPQGSSGASATNPFLSNTSLHERTGGEHDKRQDLESSEDCLYLSIYSPGHIDPSVGTNLSLPVIFWIHGGGYQMGSGVDSGYDLIPVSSGEVVVVVIQYRLGLFGFLAGDAVKQGGELNAGLLDQQFALQWTQEHISKFGGDPTQVTIWGESAGAGSVLQQVITNGGQTNPPLFKRAMTSSTFLPSQYAWNEPFPEYWYTQVVNGAGCTDAQDALECLRAADTTVLQNLDATLCRSAFVGTFVFVPVVDDALITQSPISAFLNGDVNGEGILAVTNADEGSIFIDKSLTISSNVESYLHQLFPRLSSASIDQALQIYAPVADDSTEGNLTQVIAIHAESIFVCPSYYVLRAFGSEAPGYKAEFALPPATHASDVAYYFPSTVTPTYKNENFSATFAGSFVSFALTGDPKEGSLSAWSRFEGENVEMQFNSTEAGEPAYDVIHTDEARLERCAFWNGVREETGQ